MKLQQLANSNTPLPFKSAGFSSTIDNILTKREEEYLKQGIVRSIKRNKHMNEYAGEPVDIKKAEALVKNVSGQMRDAFKDRHHFMVIDMADWCSNFGKTFSQNPLAKDFSLSEKTRDAIIVDFLNFIMLNQCCDLAMYTCDLQKVQK